MSCGTIEARVALYAGGDLDDADAGDVERHLAACDSCRELLAALRGQRDAMGEWRSAELSQGALDDVRQGVLAAIARGDARPGVLDRIRFAPWRPVAWGSAGLAAAALLVFAAWTMTRPQDLQPARDAAAQPGHAASQAAAVPATRSAETAPAPRGPRAAVRGAIPAPLPRAFAAAEMPTVTPARPKSVGTREAGSSPPDGSRAAVADVRTAADVSNAPAGPVRRIEFQTADPNIRIIWLMPEAASDPNRSGAAGR